MVPVQVPVQVPVGENAEPASLFRSYLVAMSEEAFTAYLQAMTEASDAADIPYVVIGTIDGNQKVRLRGGARASCASIRVGDYLEADGEKQHELLFDADDVTIKRGGRTVR